MGKIYKFLGRLLSNDYITAGPNNEVKNNECTAIGSNLVTGGDHQTILGKYNEELSGDYCFIIGQGTSNKRKNVLMLADNGNLTIPGSISPGSYKNLPIFVTDVSIVENLCKVTYNNGTSKTMLIGERVEATGEVTAYYTNAKTIYSITIDQPLSSVYTYTITNNATVFNVEDADGDYPNSVEDPTDLTNLSEEEYFNLHIKDYYAFDITDSDGNSYLIDVSTENCILEPIYPGDDFKFTYDPDTRTIEWTYV